MKTFTCRSTVLYALNYSLLFIKSSCLIYSYQYVLHEGLSK
jgi:hypothetical protein